jgi:hypothetical protein
MSGRAHLWRGAASACCKTPRLFLASCMMPTREVAGGSRERPLTYVSLARTVSLLLSKAFSEKARWVIRGSRLLDHKLGQDRVKIPGNICFLS